MRLIKSLTLAALAVAASLALTAPASATQATSPSGTLYTGTIHAVSEGFVVIGGPIGILVRCNSTWHLTSATHGTSITYSASFSSFSFTSCADGYTAVALAFGSIQIHSNGTITSSGLEITVSTPLGFNCIYKTNATDIGTLTGSATTGKTATIDIGGKPIPRTGHSAFCGGSGEFSGSYVINSPDSLNID